VDTRYIGLEWEDIVKLNLKETELERVDWIRVAGSCVHGNERFGSIKYCEIVE
jgi:hypothetical protein